MPKITADTVEEHVARQRQAVLDAAIHLFTTQGYNEVSLADIAAEVGLARNSLYRYVPDKVHLLVEWYRQAIPATIETWEAALAGDDPAPVRLTRWARAYLEWALTPEHQLVTPLTDAVATLDAETRQEIGALHRSMMDVVTEAVRAAGVPRGEAAGTVELLAGLVLGAARAERAARRADRALRNRLDAAVAAVVAR